MSTGYVGPGGVWVEVQDTPNQGSVSGAGNRGVFADTTALQAAYPAASNRGSTAWVGSGALTEYYSDGSTWAVVSAGGGTPGGSTTQLQFNNAGAFGGAAGLTTDGVSAITLGVAGTSVGAINLKNATSGTVTLAPATGALGTGTFTIPAGTNTAATLGANTFTGTQTIGSTQIQSSGFIVINNSAAKIVWANGTSLLEEASNVFAQRNGTSAQAFRVYNTFTDSSNGEWGAMRWNANVLEIGAYANGTGVSRALTIFAADTPIHLGNTALFSYLTLTTAVATFRSFTKVGWGAGSTGNAAQDTAMARNSAGLVEINSGTNGQYRDLLLRTVIENPVSALTLAVNGQFGVEMTSNTAGNLVYRGSDGTTRRAALVFA